MYTETQSNTYLLTGAGGFLGRSIKSYLIENGNEVIGICRGCSHYVDITKPFCLDDVKKIDVVVHAAGKAHVVPKTEAEKQAFFDVNVKGTTHLLKALEQSPALPKSFIFISSVAVYGVESGNSIKETQPLNAQDAYGISKIQAEEIVQEWCKKNNVICGILRLPLLVGTNPPGNLGAMINGIKKGYYFNIAGGKAKKSMVLAEDIAIIIPKVAKIGGVYNLTDGYHPSFYELSLSIAKQLGKQRVLNMPKLVAVILATIGGFIPKFPINKSKLNKIISDLTFDDLKAKEILKWQPSKVLDKLFVERE